MTQEASYHQLLDDLERAHADKDAEAILACYAPDARIFDLAPPLLSRGRDLEETKAWLETWRGPVRVDTAHADAIESGDIVVITALNRMRGDKVDGEKVDLWFRTTLVLKRRDGRWLIVHDHSSTPFYMDGSQRAALDLVP